MRALCIAAIIILMNITVAIVNIALMVKMIKEDEKNFDIDRKDKIK